MEDAGIEDLPKPDTAMKDTAVDAKKRCCYETKTMLGCQNTTWRLPRYSQDATRTPGRRQDAASIPGNHQDAARMPPGRLDAKRVLPGCHQDVPRTPPGSLVWSPKKYSL